MNLRHSLTLALLSLAVSAMFAAERPRLAVLTDIGGDPDDQQSLVRLMVYANEFEIEALIGSASGTRGELKEAVTRPDLIREIVAAYGKVRPNLLRHAGGWPTAERLLIVVKSGNPRREQAYIGTSWFQWVDQPCTGRMDGENYNIGLVDVTDRPYADLVEAMRTTHRRLQGVHAGTTPSFATKPRLQ